MSKGGNALRYQDLPSAAALARYAAELNARARSRQAKGQIGIDDLRDVILSSAGCCGWCAVNLTGAAFEIDHIQALNRGGNHVRSNLVLSCASCNRKKGEKAAAVFALELLAAGGETTTLISRVLREAGLSPKVPIQTKLLS
ncbi:MAG: HNH endonuclease signature motif containing protein [Chloroflexi bacterium]|nr:HNH endonuclease signature motif containing protein [Chloroflexota bacterium]